MASNASRPLDISTKDRELLAGVWERADRPSLRVDPADVESAAGALRTAIPDVVLALLIAEGRSLGDLVRLTSSIVSFYEADGTKGWRRATGFDHVAFAELPSADASEPVFGCFARTDDAAKVKLVVWNLRHPERGGEALADLRAYLKRRGEMAGQGALAKGDGAAFLPVVEAAAAAQPVTIVHHPKFGDGQVIERVGDDKLRIDFGAHGIRVLASSFVTVKP
ncbi:Hypothetical protein A7982_02564 [Minicystis rosea]|nr:Hypothetical protein A7982_02564 [Minicystis rosea]